MKSDQTEPIEEADSVLLSRMKGGDMSAFDGLFEKHRRGLFSYARGMINDRGLAEDIVQECFLELVRNIERIRPEQGAKGWLYRVARNRAIDALRAGKAGAAGAGTGSAAPSHERDPVDPSPSPLEGTVARERAEDVRHALDMLPPKERDLLLLRYFGDLKFNEIARLQKRPLGTVLWQATRSLEKIRKLLSGIESN